MSFTDQIGQLTGSSSANSGTTIAQSLENAQIDVIQKIALVQPAMLHQLSTEVATQENGHSNNALVNNIVLNVKRKDATDGYLDTSQGNDYLTVDSASTSSSPYNITSATGGTFSFWVKFKEITEVPIFSSNAGYNNNVSNNAGWRIIKGSDNRLYIQWGRNQGSFVDGDKSYYRRVTADNILTTDTWYHVAIRTSFGVTSGGTEIYINGVLSDITETGNATFSGASPEYNGANAKAFIGYHIKLNDGAGATESYGKMHLKDFGIYNSKLTALQTQSLYNNGVQFDLRKKIEGYTDTSSLYIYWDFTNESAITLQDIMGNYTTLLTRQNTAAFVNYDYNASYIDNKYITQSEDMDSIYYADSKSPVYSIVKNKVVIYPEPTTTDTVTITKVVPGAINDSAETIADMPRFLHNQIVKIASYYVLLRRLGDLRDTFYTEYNDAITKAKSLVDDASGLTSGTEDAEYWLKEEDPEMLSSTLSTAGQEIQRASSVAGKFTTDYQWMTNQLGILKQLVDQGWESIFNKQVDKDIGRIGDN